jgi:predicted phage tail protein
MFKKILTLFFSGLLLLNIYGCFALFVGAAAGTGTAVWLSGKLTQEFNASYERTINAAKKALRSLKLEIIKETKEVNVTQLKSRYTDGRDIWIDISKVTENTTKVEVRVGVVKPDKAAADNIFKKIRRYL